MMVGNDVSTLTEGRDCGEVNSLVPDEVLPALEEYELAGSDVERSATALTDCGYMSSEEPLVIELDSPEVAIKEIFDPSFPEEDNDIWLEE